MGDSIIEKVLDWIYPPRCPICGEITDDKINYVCTDCKNKVFFIKEPRCMKCSKPILNAEKEYCYDCEKGNFHYEKGKALWIYDDIMKKSISEFKYHGRKEYSKFYGKFLADQYGNWVRKMNADALIPVPLHRQKQKARGYNQAELIAREVGARIGIPVKTDILYRKQYTMPQKELNDVERRKNLARAFEVKEDTLFLKKVILIDDIYTTGSTIEACTNVLLEHGIQQVFFLSVCIGKGF